MEPSAVSTGQVRPVQAGAVPQRITVVGPGGAGKSTLAARIGPLLGLPVIHLDREYWLPGWVRPDPESWQRRVRELAGRDRWVIDGNYGGTLGARVERADLIVLLDLPRRVTIPSALYRTVRARHRPDMAPGCDERIDVDFLRWLWRYPTESRPLVHAAVDAARARDRLVVLRSRRAAARWAESLRPPEAGR